jgi:GPI mannosyltransferase 3
MKIKYIYALSIIILVITAFFSTGYYHFDEHYQMRPAIQPGIVVLISHIFNATGVKNPFTITLFLRLLSAALAFLGMYLIYKSFSKTILNDTLKRWFAILSFLLWFMIYNNVRFSSENWSGSIFLIAYSLLNIKQFPNIGVLLGLSF